MELKDFIKTLTHYKHLIHVPMHLILDSGHGTSTKGKRSTDGSLRENTFNTSIEAKMGILCSLAKSVGIDITYSNLSLEHQDTKLYKRTEREKKFYKENKEDRLCFGLSFHADAFSKESANGTGAFINKGSKSRLFAEIALNNIAKVTGLKNRGVRTKSLHMTKYTASPFVLFEAAFMTNNKELKLLKSESFRNLYTLTLFESWLEFVSIHQDTFFKRK
jgi:N-acetylmuramoyl-L-alanine amidase